MIARQDANSSAAPADQSSSGGAGGGGSGGGVFLRATGISKRFGITQALDNVSVEFRRGEVHALMGENGAGKSTLGKILSGLHKPDEGRIEIDGREIRPGVISDSYKAGIRIVHQELAQCPNLSVAENLCLHAMPTTNAGLVDRRAMEARASRLLQDLEPAIDVRAMLSTLSPGHRQIVQIAGGMDSGDEREGGAEPRVLVLDEPTSSLSITEVDRLLEIVRRLAARGLTIIYVSHRMGEIFAVCDRVSVLRDGKYVATSIVRDITEADLVEQMIGRRLSDEHMRSHKPIARGTGAKALLEVEGLSSPGKLEDVSLRVYPGEVLGVGGLVGAGRSELLDAIFGVDAYATGRVRAMGHELCAANGHRGPRSAIAAGVGYVPEDRKLQGLFFLLGVGENISVPRLPMLASMLGLRDLRRERDLNTRQLGQFQIKAASLAAVPGSLSGGNQQKLLIARWMDAQTKVLLLDEPTRGIDVGTKAEIYRHIRAAADSGAAVLLVSSEMPELLRLSDRVVVMSEGRLAGELMGEDMTQTNILKLATKSERVIV